MINTYQTSLPAPAVPPRLHRAHPVLVPSPLPAPPPPGHSRSLVRFLAGAMLLNFVLSVGGFIYLYHFKMENNSPADGRAAFRSSVKQESSHNALARMRVDLKSLKEPQVSSGYLKWDTTHSLLRNINYFRSSWLTIKEPGAYYVFSRVTFSKGDSRHALTTAVVLRKSDAAREEEVVMRAHCSLDHGGAAASNPQMCTATQGEVMLLEKGNQLGVWIQDLSLVNYSEEVTAFGMYKI